NCRPRGGPEEAAPPAPRARHPHRRLRGRSPPIAQAAVCRRREGRAHGLSLNLLAWKHVTFGSPPTVRIRGSICPEEKQKNPAPAAGHSAFSRVLRRTRA